MTNINLIWIFTKNSYIVIIENAYSIKIITITVFFNAGTFQKSTYLSFLSIFLQLNICSYLCRNIQEKQKAFRKSANSIHFKGICCDWNMLVLCGLQKLIFIESQDQICERKNWLLKLFLCGDVEGINILILFILQYIIIKGRAAHKKRKEEFLRKHSCIQVSFLIKTTLCCSNFVENLLLLAQNFVMRKCIVFWLRNARDSI